MGTILHHVTTNVVSDMNAHTCARIYRRELVRFRVVSIHGQGHAPSMVSRYSSLFQNIYPWDVANHIYSLCQTVRNCRVVEIRILEHLLEQPGFFLAIKVWL